MTSRTTGIKIYVAALCCLALALIVIMPPFNSGAVYAQGGTVTPVISGTVTTAATVAPTAAATTGATIAATSAVSTAATSAATAATSATAVGTRTAPTTLPSTGQSGPLNSDWIVPLAILVLLAILGVVYALSRPSRTTR